LEHTGEKKKGKAANPTTNILIKKNANGKRRIWAGLHEQTRRKKKKAGQKNPQKKNGRKEENKSTRGGGGGGGL